MTQAECRETVAKFVLLAWILEIDLEDEAEACTRAHWMHSRPCNQVAVILLSPLPLPLPSLLYFLKLKLCSKLWLREPGRGNPLGEFHLSSSFQLVSDFLVFLEWTGPSISVPTCHQIGMSRILKIS